MSLELRKSIELQKVGAEYLTLPPLMPDETGIIAMRHGKYERKATSENAGRLTEQGRPEAKALLDQAVRNILENIPARERDTLDVLVVASPTKYHGGQRSYETAQEALKAVEEAGIPRSNILNVGPSTNDSRITDKSKMDTQDGPQPYIAVEPDIDIVEPKFLTESPEFFELLNVVAAERGIERFTPAWWAIYENDEFKEKREEFGAEGPLEMAARLDRAINRLGKVAHEYHAENPGRRLLVIVSTHYDTISPYVKNYLAGIPQTDYLNVDYAGGFGVHISKEGKAITKIGGHEFEIPLQS